MRLHNVVLVFEVGAIRVMCQHIEPKGNRWYYRRRIPQDCRELHRVPQSKKAPEQLYFSLKTANKAEACKLAVSHTRRLDALWKAHRQGNVDPKVSLAQLQAAGLSPGDGPKYPDLDPVRDFVGDLLGHAKQWEDRPALSRQAMTHDMLMTGSVPKTLSDARDKHIALGKLFRDPQAQDLAQTVADDAKGNVDGLVLDRSAVGIADLHPQGVEDGGSGNGGGAPFPRRRIGYIRSSARLCQSRTSSRTASVTRLIRSGETLRP